MKTQSIFVLLMIGPILISGCVENEVKKPVEYEFKYRSILDIEPRSVNISNKVVAISFFSETAQEVGLTVLPRIDESDKEKIGVIPSATAHITVGETKVVYGIRMALKELQRINAEYTDESYLKIIMTMTPNYEDDDIC